MPPAITSEDLAKAFALQAKADFAAREVLAVRGDVPECQPLHFLQMACEKLCKAHLLLHKTRLDHLESSHAYIAKTLPIIILQLLGRAPAVSRTDRSVLLRSTSRFAREIELLAPAVDDNGKRPDNCEYPWIDDGGHLRIPAEHDFANLRFLKQEFGRLFLKLVRQAIQDLASEGARA